MNGIRRVYHITHGRNLPGIVADGGLWSDARAREREACAAPVGMTKIKQRRLSTAVRCQPGTHVGDYVPFYFCPRSVMLYLLHRSNHPDLDYREGQRPIVHLSAPVDAVVDWAERAGRRWACSDRNAAMAFAHFGSDRPSLDALNWEAIAATDFRDAVVKEAKQAELLVHEFFPFELVDYIGVIDGPTGDRVTQILAAGNHRPPVHIRRDWYY